MQTKLFGGEADPGFNLLPYDGEVNYFGKILPANEADKYFNIILDTIEWRHDEAIIFGKHIITKRKVAWYGDKEYEYKYSNITKKALPWTKELKELKLLTEKLSEESYNSCLLNLYHNGEEGMAYHRDEEKDLKENGAIASLTLGAERKFLFRHIQNKETVSLVLEHGSLLIMKGATQTHWMHRLPPSKKVKTPRINLTFRTIV